MVPKNFCYVTEQEALIKHAQYKDLAVTVITFMG